MLQIDFAKNPETTRKYIVINSVEDRDSYSYETKDGISVTLYSEEAITEILKSSFKEVGKFLSNFSYDIEVDDWDFWIDININCKKDNEVVSFIEAEFRVETEEWNKPYSLLEFSKELSSAIEIEDDVNCKYYQSDEEFVSNGFGILFTSPEPKTLIGDFEEIAVEKIERILRRTTLQLISNLDKEIITTFFTFPDNIKTACKQYLIYFAQFLMDMGIEVDTEVKEEAHNTLFKIIPKDSNESLDQIKNALNVYLNAPGFDNFKSQIEINNNIAVMQWQANILHLQSQLTLANSVLQLKEATIQSLQLSNYQLQEIISEKLNQNDTDKEEDIIKGVVSIKKYEGKGFSINLAEILRRLKRTFK